MLKCQLQIPERIKKISVPKFERFSGDQIMFKSIQQEIAYDFPHYFSYLFDTMFLSLLSPFRCCLSEEYKTLSYVLQKLPCGGIHLAVCILSILKIRYEFSEYVTEKPEKIFLILNHLCWAWFILLFVKLIWSGKFGIFLNYKATQITYKVRMSLYSYFY